MPQTEVTQTAARATPGKLATSAPHSIISTIVEETGEIEPGMPVVRGVGGDRTARRPPAMVADVDAFKTNIASTAGIQTFTAVDLDGVIGAAALPLAAKVVLVLNANAAWNATTAVLSGLDKDGIPISENLSIPADTGGTLTSVNYYSKVTGLVIPAQTGAGGTATLGYAADFTFDGGAFLGLALHQHKTRFDGAYTNCENYTDEEQMSVLESGPIFVRVENAGTAGDILHVRLIAAGAEKIGAYRAHDTDGGDCIPLRRLRLVESCSAGGVAEARLIAA